VLDELHALVTSSAAICCRSVWRGSVAGAADSRDRIVGHRRRRPQSLRGFLCATGDGLSEAADIVVAGVAAAAIVEMLDTAKDLPWAGHSGAPCAP